MTRVFSKESVMEIKVRFVGGVMDGKVAARDIPVDENTRLPILPVSIFIPNCVMTNTDGHGSTVASTWDEEYVVTESSPIELVARLKGGDWKMLMESHNCAACGKPHMTSAA